MTPPSGCAGVSANGMFAGRGVAGIDPVEGANGLALTFFIQAGDFEFDLVHDAIFLMLGCPFVTTHQITQMRR